MMDKITHRIVTLNRWIWSHDLEAARAGAWGSGLADWKWEQYDTWCRERASLIDTVSESASVEEGHHNGL